MPITFVGASAQAARLGWFQISHLEENVYKDNQARNPRLLLVGIAYF
jgi:hypothetical protein